jgi:hypothetical protein
MVFVGGQQFVVSFFGEWYLLVGKFFDEFRFWGQHVLVNTFWFLQTKTNVYILFYSIIVED